MVSFTWECNNTVQEGIARCSLLSSVELIAQMVISMIICTLQETLDGERQKEKK